MKQCEKLKLPFLTDCPQVEDLNLHYQVVVDALFGFSYKGPEIRHPFHGPLSILRDVHIPIASVDVPSGKKCLIYSIIIALSL